MGLLCRQNDCRRGYCASSSCTCATQSEKPPPVSKMLRLVLGGIRVASHIHSLIYTPLFVYCFADYSGCSTFAPKLVQRVAKAIVGSFTAPSNEFTRVDRDDCGVSDRPIVRAPELDCHCCHVARGNLDQIALSEQCRPNHVCCCSKGLQCRLKRRGRAIWHCVED